MLRNQWGTTPLESLCFLTPVCTQEDTLFQTTWNSHRPKRHRVDDKGSNVGSFASIFWYSSGNLDPLAPLMMSPCSCQPPVPHRRTHETYQIPLRRIPLRRKRTDMTRDERKDLQRSAVKSISGSLKNFICYTATFCRNNLSKFDIGEEVCNPKYCSIIRSSFPQTSHSRIQVRNKEHIET